MLDKAMQEHTKVMILMSGDLILMAKKYNKALLFLIISLFSVTAWGEDTPGEPSEGSAPAMTTYIDLQPAFVVNYGGVGRLRFLRAEISLRVEMGGEPLVMHHMPYLRHELIMLLSKQTDEAIATTEGRELLRIEALDAIRTALTVEEGDHKIKDLLFSTFVVQR